ANLLVWYAPNRTDGASTLDDAVNTMRRKPLPARIIGRNSRTVRTVPSTLTLITHDQSCSVRRSIAPNCWTPTLEQSTSQPPSAVRTWSAAAATDAESPMSTRVDVAVTPSAATAE